MDGTLTIAAHDFDSIRAELNIDAGTPILEAIATMPPVQAEATRRELHRLEMEVAHQSAPQPDAEALLEALTARGCRLGILTRNAEDIASATLSAAGLTRFFPTQHVVGRERCTPKPDPAGIHYLLQQWQGQPATTAMVGDYHFDLDAGRNASVTTVHFSPEGEFLWPDKTDVAVHSLSELLGYLE